MNRKRFLVQELQRVDGVKPGSGLPKHVKMAQSPFVFMRGAAQVFYADIANQTLRLPKALGKIPLTAVMGDCHVSNFGFLTEEGSHGDRVIFAPNDFDDACIGHAGWDLARFGLSLLLCAEHCRGVVKGRYAAEEIFQGKSAVSKTQALMALGAFLDSYQETCVQVDDRQHHERVVDRFKKKHILSKLHKKAIKRAAGGKDFLHKSALAKSVDLNAFPLRFRELPERFVQLRKKERQDLVFQLEPYMDDQILDVVERIGAGTGSNNMRRFYLLVGPKPGNAKNRSLCHIVEVKQQRQAAPIHYFPDLSPINRLNAAHLTVVCQRRMQREPDLLLDELQWKGAHWLVRSRHHARVGIDPEHLAIGKRAVDKDGFQQYAELCGAVLALTHARVDRRSTRFERQVGAVAPKVRNELMERLQGYVEQVRQDRMILAELEKLQ